LFVFLSSTFFVSLETGVEAFPCKNGPSDCVNPKQDELAILVTGNGRTATGKSAEILSTNGTSICELPEMPLSRNHHTQSGLTACGGYGDDLDSLYTCMTFQSGSWTTLTDNLPGGRDQHSSWVTPDGDILLIGGTSTETSTAIVFQNGSSIRSFDLMHRTLQACVIELPEMFIVTGGYYSTTKVSKYSTSGWIEDLPELNEGRYDQGCGFFYNDDMERVFLVAGGYSVISSTETLVEGGEAWNFQERLPSDQGALRGISLPDTVLMTGGEAYKGGYHVLDDVLMFDSKTSDWKKIGSMKNKRYLHAASLVSMADVINYCK